MALRIPDDRFVNTECPIVVRRSDPRWNHRNKAQRMWRLTSKYTYTFSRRLIERVAEKNGLTLIEAEELVRKVGDEFNQIFYEGHAVCFPTGPILYSWRLDSPVGKKKDGSLNRINVLRAHVKMTFHARKRLNSLGVSRGPLPLQFYKERVRLCGSSTVQVVLPRTKDRRWKKNDFRIVLESGHVIESNPAIRREDARILRERKKERAALRGHKRSGGSDKRAGSSGSND